jgi:hypothetical protein
MTDPILDFLDQESYYYGTTPKQAVAEQNQTYFAYFDTLADTSPILQDHTAYYVKYIIDTDGNPVNPEPDSNPNRPQAIGLYNLLDNFEVGKKATIKTITNDPLYDIPPNSYMLNGSYPIVHVGRLTPILLTTTGSGPNDFVRQIDFQDTLGNPIAQAIPNLFLNYRATYSDLTIGTGEIFPFAQVIGQQGDPGIWSTPSGYGFTFNYPGGTISAGTRIKIQVRLALRKVIGQTTSVGSISSIAVNFKINGNTIHYASISVSSGTYQYYSRETPYFEMNEGDEISINLNKEIGFTQIIGTSGDSDPATGASDTAITVYQQTPASSGLINGITGTTSSYWTVDTSNYEPSPGLSVLTGSQYLTQLYNIPDIIQTTPTASIQIGYPIISTFFNPILPGDKIKFTLNETDVHTIIDVNVGNNLGFSALFLTIIPPIDGNTNLNNFTIYRIINDGTSVILEVKKDISGSAYAGVVQPQFVSKELIDNYDKIITNLTEREIIN